MTRELLREASGRLKDAAEAASGDAQERIYDRSDALASLAARDRDPDHGRLARHTNTLEELADETEAPAHEAIVEAKEKISTFREGVEGV